MFPFDATQVCCSSTSQLHPTPEGPVRHRKAWLAVWVNRFSRHLDWGYSVQGQPLSKRGIRSNNEWLPNAKSHLNYNIFNSCMRKSTPKMYVWTIRSES